MAGISSGYEMEDAAGFTARVIALMAEGEAGLEQVVLVEPEKPEEAGPAADPAADPAVDEAAQAVAEAKAKRAFEALEELSSAEVDEIQATGAADDADKGAA